MQTEPPTNRAIRPHALRQSARASLLWLVLAGAGGFLFTLTVNEHNAIVFTFVGAGLGVAGAISHVAVLSFARRHAIPLPAQVVLVAGGAIFLLLLSTLFISPGQAPRAIAVTSAMSAVLVYAAIPSLLIASIVSAAVKSAA